MTRELARNILTEHIRLMGDDSSLEEDREAFEFAISELEQEPCEDAISREEALNALLDYWHDIQCVDGSGYDVYEDSAEVINDLPPVQPSRRKGHWIITPLSVTGRHYQCSECKYIHTFTKFEYCPKCGAEMESEE